MFPPSEDDIGCSAGMLVDDGKCTLLDLFDWLAVPMPLLLTVLPVLLFKQDVLKSSKLNSGNDVDGDVISDILENINRFRSLTFSRKLSISFTLNPVARNSIAPTLFDALLQWFL